MLVCPEEYDPMFEARTGVALIATPNRPPETRLNMIFFAVGFFIGNFLLVAADIASDPP